MPVKSARMAQESKTKWDLRLNRAGPSSRVLQPKGLAMADEVVNEAPVAVPEAPVVVQPAEAPVVVQPAVDPADVEEPVVKTGAKTIDSHEASVGWTSQQGDAPSEPEPRPGNVVTYAELPYKASLVAAGVDLDQYHAGLVVVADDAERDSVRGVGDVPEGVPEVAADDGDRARVLSEDAPVLSEE